MMSKTRWEILILETVQMGGTLVFLKENVHHLESWLKPIHEYFQGEIPYVCRHKQDLVSGKFETKPQDLVFFFSSQVKYLQELDGVLQGQRVLLSETEVCEVKEFFDFIWPLCSLTEWTQSFQKTKVLWPQKEPVVEVSESHLSPCLFLDRDDVVVRNVPYNRDPEKVELMPGIGELISKAHQKGYWVALVTNQSGLGRGLISWHEYQQVHQRTMQLLAQQGCWLDEVVWSGYIDREDIPQGRLLAGLRKPRAGMFQMVNSKLKVNMTSSVMVGDSASDLIAARSAGVQNLFLLASDKLEKEKQKLAEFQKKHVDFDFQVALKLADISL